jgi:predicted nuclease with TOPRIM domain
MSTLLNNYSISQIVLFSILVVMALKDLLVAIDYLKNKGKEHYDEEEKYIKEKEKIYDSLDKDREEIKKIAENQISVNDSIQKLNEKIDMLIESDKDDIKSFITKEHHYYVEQKKWIDKFSLDCIEKRYKHYKDEGGNSFIEDLMGELRKLPKQPPQE